VHRVQQVEEHVERVLVRGGTPLEHTGRLLGDPRTQRHYDRVRLRARQATFG
jgi:hypothetical protein